MDNDNAPISLSEICVVDDLLTNEDMESVTVYGLASSWTDGSRLTVRDITDDGERLRAFCSLLAENNIEKVHFWDVIEDFLA